MNHNSGHNLIIQSIMAYFYSRHTDAAYFLKNRLPGDLFSVFQEEGFVASGKQRYKRVRKKTE